MAITTLAGYIAAKKESLSVDWSTNTSSVGGGWTSLVGDTALGLSNKTPGSFPNKTQSDQVIVSDGFAAGARGILSKLVVNCGVYGSLRENTYILFDRLWQAGQFVIGTDTFPATINSGMVSTRVPGGTDFTNTELWVEAVAAFTGNLSIAVTYVNQDGVIAQTTGTFATGIAPIVRRCIRIPLQAGDTGIKEVTDVTASVSTAGTFNLLVLRRLGMGYHSARHMQNKYPKGVSGSDMLDTGMVEVFADMCPFMMLNATTTSTGTVNSIDYEVASG